MIKNILLLSLLLSLCLPDALQACSCYKNVGTVCEILNRTDDTYFFKGYVYYANPNSYPGEWRIKVLDNISDHMTSDTIVFVQDNSCLEPLVTAWNTVAQEGDTVVFHAFHYQTPYNPSTDFDYFAIGICRQIPLVYENGTVQASMTTQISELSYADFKDFVRNTIPEEELFCERCYCEEYFNITFYPWLDLPVTFCGTLDLLSSDLDNDDLLIARVRFSQLMEHGIKGEIVEILRGAESETSINVWGKIGSECREDGLVRFLDKEVLTILRKLGEDDLIGPNEAAGDYQIIECGVHNLLIDGASVTGPITAVAQEMPYSQMHDLVNGGFENTENCSKISNSTTEVRQQAAIIVFPNPSNGAVTIDGTAIPIQDLVIRIFNSSGQLLWQKTEQAGQDIQLGAEELASKGIYWIQIQGEGFSHTEKLVRL
ncbi:MAG: T9SS type A sorting domain-containing protein [Bacteroidota bacterium]